MKRHFCTKGHYHEDVFARRHFERIYLGHEPNHSSSPNSNPDIKPNSNTDPSPISNPDSKL